ncbi:MAG: MFS transporter, partial [Blastocatellia bacterium]
MSPRRALWPIYLSVAISYMGVGLVVPLISIVLAEHGSNTFVVGLVGTTMFAALTVAALPVGLATDRFGPRIILVSGLIVYGGAIFLFAFTRDIWQFFLIRVVEGTGGAAISVATETMISHASGEGDRSRRMSYYALSVGLGWALGPIAGTWLFQVHPAAPFVACFGFSLIAAILVATFGPRVSSHDHARKGLVKALNFRIVVPISSGALYGFMMASLVTLLPLYLASRNITNVLMGTIITSVIIGTIASQIPIGWAADLFGPRKVLI